jgi:hypothetical protein
MNLSKIKNVFLRILIGCLVAAALLAVVTVLVGTFNDILGKALTTIMLIALHSLVSFSFITNNEKQDTFENLSFFTNTTFVLIMLSFITSVFGVWGLLPGDIVAKLYGLYFVLLFAVLHGEVLYKTTGKQATVDRLVGLNYLFMIIVVALLIPVIFTGVSDVLGSLYYRILAACGIVDATLTLIVSILHKLYVQKHPEVQDAIFGTQSVVTPGQPGVPAGSQPMVAPVQQQRHGMNIFVMLLIGYLVLQVLGTLFFGLIGLTNR